MSDTFIRIGIITIGIFLLLNSIQNVFIFTSVSASTPFWYEPSGMQLLYPVTIGLFVYLILWIANMTITKTYKSSRAWFYLPLILAFISAAPIVLNLVGILPLPKSNYIFYSYGMLLTSTWPAIVFLCCLELYKSRKSNLE